MASKDEERDIIVFYQQGLSVPELSNRYGISDKRLCEKAWETAYHCSAYIGF